MALTFKEISRRLRFPFNKKAALRRLAEFHAAPHDLEEIVDKAMHMGGKGYMRVRTVQYRSEIMRLARAVADLKPRTILEIGTFQGGTLFIWAHLANRLAVSCDLADMRYSGQLYRRFPPPGSDCRIELLSGDSHTQAFYQRVVRELGGEKVDFLFIDGDHTESGVTIDYQLYKGLVRPGGIIAFHDIVENQPVACNQVFGLWEKLKRLAQVEEYVNDPAQCGCGIGILRVPEGGAPDVA